MVGHVPKLLVITEKGVVLSVDGRKRLGSCLRCGQCCRVNRGCEHLRYETLDGRPTAICAVYFDRPLGCAVWPLPDSTDVPDGCGFRYEEK
jgi:hypothetical protein